VLAPILIFVFATQAPTVVAEEKARADVQPAQQAPTAISKVDVHAANLSTQPNMRSTGVMVDAEGRIHVLCVDPSIPELESHMQTRVQKASHHTISVK
jgi:hypothetical protein